MTFGTVTSKDGTKIAFDQSGSGPVVILVGGATQHRAFDHGMKRLEELLAPHFTVIHYDRRGRGDSGDTLPFAVEREIEDIDALIDHADRSAFVYGISSGAALALEAALALDSKVSKLALFEPPYNDDAVAQERWRTYRRELAETLAADRRGDAMALFMMLVGMSPDSVPAARQMPQWPQFEQVAPTLAYDAAALGDDATIPAARAAHLTIPVLVVDGSDTMPFMRTTAAALARAIPNGQYRTLDGQTHNVASEVLAPVLIEFFNA